MTHTGPWVPRTVCACGWHCGYYDNIYTCPRCGAGTGNLDSRRVGHKLTTPRRVWYRPSTWLLRPRVTWEWLA